SLSCTNWTPRPAAANFRSSQDSKKWPRASGKTAGRTSTTSGISMRSNCISSLPACNLQQILSVPRTRKRQGEALELRRIDETRPVGDLLRAAHLQSLPLLDRLDEHRGLQQRLMRAGIKPGYAAAEELHTEYAERQIGSVDVGDFELPAGRRFQ